MMLPILDRLCSQRILITQMKLIFKIFLELSVLHNQTQCKLKVLLENDQTQCKLKVLLQIRISIIIDSNKIEDVTLKEKHLNNMLCRYGVLCLILKRIILL